jgi:integration host factor subunit alpha
MPKLTKTEIIQAVMEQTGFNKHKATEVVETLMELLKKTMASGENVLISGFGKYVVQEKAPRRGRNPATGEDLTIRSRRIVTFKWARNLKDKINSDSTEE